MSIMSDAAKSLKVFQRGPTIPGPVRVASRHKPTLLGRMAMERWISLSGSVPGQLKALAQLRASNMVGCTW